jgi:hypothetical protein
MTTPLRLRLGSKSSCSVGVLALATLGLVACGGDGASPQGADSRDEPTAGSSGSGGSAGNASGGSNAGSGGSTGGAGSSGNAGTAGSAGSAPATACERDPVCRSLSALGVDTETTSRLARGGEPLPDSWNPLGGARRSLYPKMELFAGGMRAAGAASHASVLELHDDDAAEAARDHRLMRELGDTAWTAAPVHAAVAGDIDGDGVQEIAGVWLDAGVLKLRVVSDVESSDRQADVVLGDYAAQSVSVAAGDFDGDGRDELAVAVVLRNETHVLFVDDERARFAVDARQALEIPRVAPTAELRWKLAAGNLDNDAAAELVAVANEVTDWSSGAATSEYRVWDDLGADGAELDGGPVVVRAGSLYTALTAGAAIVDMDNDGLGEVVLAGITSYDQNQGTLHYAMATLDDASNRFAPIAGKHFGVKVDQTDSSSPPRYRTVWVNGLDIDGDLVPELQVNEYVFGNLSQPSGSDTWPERYRISLGDFQPNGGRDFDFATENSAMAVGDVNGDRRDDIVCLGPEKEDIRVFGLTGVTPAFSRFLTIPVTELERTSSTSPLLVPVNVDRDTAVLEYTQVESDFVFTEPVVLAAVAAPPCAEGIGQNTDACRTSFGHGTSEDVTTENSVTLSASMTFGVSFEDRLFTQSQVEIEATATIASTHTESHGYTVEKSVTFTTGAMEDAVVFTTVPYDRYVYTVLSHPDPEMVGHTMTVNVPREPLTLMVERDFYNEHVVEGSPKIDAEIFQHRPGDVASYPSLADKNALIRLFGGLDNGPMSTDQGTGEKTLGIDVGSAYATGSELAIGFEFGAKLTFGGVMAGFTVGAETSDSLTVTSGSSTSYSGTVGAIDAGHFADEQYSFGLFTYPYETPSGRKFQVVNYWVE